MKNTLSRQLVASATRRPAGRISVIAHTCVPIIMAAVNYEIVLKLFGIVTPHERALAVQYAEAARFGGAFTILYDVGATAGRVNVSMAARQALPEGIRTCLYSFERVKQLFPMMRTRFLALSRKWRPETQRHMFVAKNFMVEAPIALMQLGQLEGCEARPVRDYVWAVEADAAFSGNVRTFFNAFLSDTSDLLSTGYMIADKRWWAFTMNTLEPKPMAFNRTSIHSLREPMAEPLCDRSPVLPDPTTSFGFNPRFYKRALIDDIRWSAGKCSALGSVFRLTMVERYSSRFMRHLAALLADGRYASSEHFSSTACAIEQSWCKMGDWAATLAHSDKQLPQQQQQGSGDGDGGANANGHFHRSSERRIGRRIDLEQARGERADHTWADHTRGERTDHVVAASTAVASGVTAPSGGEADGVRQRTRLGLAPVQLGNQSWLAVDGVLPQQGYRSALYYYPARFTNVASWCDVCDCANARRMRNRWIHPVGELKRSLKGEHPAVWALHRRAGSPRHTVQACLAAFPGCPSQCRPFKESE